MTKHIALISDTHGQLEDDVIENLRDADEIWHAGDLGSINLLERMEGLATVRAVYGNIDDHNVRAALPLDLHFECEGVSVFMTHIGGYPGRYRSRVKTILEEHRPDLYICGHSHICKVMPDRQLGVLHMNPGACGHIGLHSIRTLLRLKCDDGKITDVNVVELGRRGRIKG